MSGLRDLALRLLLQVEGGPKAAGEVRGLGQAAEEVGQKTKQSAAGTDQAAQAIQRLQSSAARAVKSLVGAAGIAVAVQQSVQNYTQFEGKIREVSTLLDDTSGLDNLTQKTRELAREYGTAPVEQAQALYSIISAGAGTAAEQTDLLTAANKLAVGGVTDVNTAADGLTSVLNAYGLKAGDSARISDGLFAAMKAGKTTVGELSSSLGQVTPIAAQTGVNFEEVAAATATLTKGGVSTSQAVTQLRGIISSVLKPSKEAADLARELGIGFDVQALKAKGLSGFLEDVADKTGGNAEQMAVLFGQVEALGGALSLTGTQADDFAAILDNVSNSAGETDKAVAKATDGDNAALKRFRAAIGDLSISIGELISVGLVPLAQAATTVINAINGLPDPVKRAIGVVGGLATAVASLRVAKAALLPLFALTAGGMGSVATAAGAATTATILKTNAVRALTLALRATPWGIAATAALGLGTAIFNVVQANRELEASQKKVTDDLKAGIDEARRAADANAVAGLQVQSTLAAVASGVENLSGAQRQFYASNLAKQEEYLQAQIRIGVRENELYGQTQVNLQATGEQLREVRAAQQALADTVAAAQPLTPNQVVSDQVIGKVKALGDEIQKVTVTELEALRSTAVNAFAEASSEAEVLSAKFPGLAGASADFIAKFAPDLAVANERVAGLGAVIDTVREEALRRLGVDASAVLTGIDTEAVGLLETFDLLASGADADARLIQGAFEALLKQLDTPEEIESLKRSLATIRDPAFDAADALAAIEQRLKDIQDEGEETANVVSDAFRRLRIESSAQLQQQAQEARQAFEIIRQSGVASLADIERARDAAAQAENRFQASLKTRAQIEREAAAAARETASADREGAASADVRTQSTDRLSESLARKAEVEGVAPRDPRDIPDRTSGPGASGNANQRPGFNTLSATDQQLIAELEALRLQQQSAASSSRSRGVSTSGPGSALQSQNEITAINNELNTLLRQLTQGGSAAEIARQTLRGQLGLGPGAPDPATAAVNQQNRNVQTIRIELPRVGNFSGAAITTTDANSASNLQAFIEQLLRDQALTGAGA